MWKKIQNNIKTFQLDEEPILIHIIKTGFNDQYMIVYEDAYEVDLGKVEFYTAEAIKERFKIDIENA